MKHAVSFFALFALCAAEANAEAHLSLQGPASPVNVGSQFSIDVKISGVSDLYAYQFDVGFDPAFASALLVTEGPFLPSGGATLFFPGSIDNIGGLVSYTAGTLTGFVSGVSGDGTLAVLTFKALAEGTGGFSLLSPLLDDSVLSPISPTQQNTTVTATAAVPEPSAALLLLFFAGAAGSLRRKLA